VEALHFKERRIEKKKKLDYGFCRNDEQRQTAQRRCAELRPGQNAGFSGQSW
jgi:hypothetical protein